MSIRGGSNEAIGVNPGIGSEARHYESMDHKQSIQTVMVRRERESRSPNNAQRVWLPRPKVLSELRRERKSADEQNRRLSRCEAGRASQCKR